MWSTQAHSVGPSDASVFSLATKTTGSEFCYHDFIGYSRWGFELRTFLLWPSTYNFDWSKNPERIVTYIKELYKICELMLSYSIFYTQMAKHNNFRDSLFVGCGILTSKLRKTFRTEVWKKTIIFTFYFLYYWNDNIHHFSGSGTRVSESANRN